jgi:hypothetical protein
MPDLQPTKATALIGESIVLGAPGVYDPELQLDEEGVVALKSALSDDPYLCSRLCAHIVYGLVSHSEGDRIETSWEAPAIVGKTERFVKERFSPRYNQQIAEKVGSMSVKWFQGLERALALPEAEWPIGMTPPATFSIALEELRVKETQNG